MKLLKVHDEYLEFLRWRWSNGPICCCLGSAQLVITCAALGQHIYSLVRYDQVLKCEFNSSFKQNEPYLSSDIIVYDFGLFNRLWGIDKCIAIYLDGGFMRFFWCINQILAIIGLILISLCIREPRPFLIWPVLTIQSIYAIGLLILTISSLPKFLPSIFDQLGRDSLFAMLIYLLGASMNFFFTYVLWHYYWFLEAHEKRTLLLSSVN